MFTKTIYAAGALAFIAGSNAHMIINTPTPYGFSTLQTSPLNGEGYNFPCQSGTRTDAFDAEGASNPMTVGEDNDLKFTGSAVHGGGSCQVSVTYDSPPPADKSKWKVIHSFVGSCPAVAAGNLVQSGTDADQRPTGPQCTSSDETECLRTLQFQIPEGMKNGNATLAWTWFNKLGNREMYMNCAPISISGGSDDDTYFNSLPELFVANIPGECTTDDAGGIIGFPNPGDQVTYGEAITPGANGGCAAASSGNSTSSSSAASSYAASTYAASTSSAATYAASSYAASSTAAASDAVELTYSAEINAKTSAAASEPETSTVVDSQTSIVDYTTMVTVTGYSPSSALAAVTSAVSSIATSAAAAVSSVASALPTAASTSTYSSASSNSTCGDGKVSCTSPGDIVCIGDAEFGLCNIDYCAVPEALAAGTSCSDGVINASEKVRRGSRMHRHAAGHILKRNF